MKQSIRCPEHYQGRYTANSIQIITSDSYNPCMYVEYDVRYGNAHDNR